MLSVVNRRHPHSDHSGIYRSWRGGVLHSLDDLGVSQRVKKEKKYTVLLDPVNCVKYSSNLEARREEETFMEGSALNHLEPHKDHW